MHLSCVTNLGIILKLRKAVHYAENAVIPISQKSKCLFMSGRMMVLKGKWNTIKIHYKNGSDFLL